MAHLRVASQPTRGRDASRTPPEFLAVKLKPLSSRNPSQTSRNRLDSGKSSAKNRTPSVSQVPTVPGAAVVVIHDKDNAEVIDSSPEAKNQNESFMECDQVIDSSPGEGVAQHIVVKRGTEPVTRPASLKKLVSSIGSLGNDPLPTIPLPNSTDDIESYVDRAIAEADASTGGRVAEQYQLTPSASSEPTLHLRGTAVPPSHPHSTTNPSAGQYQQYNYSQTNVGVDPALVAQLAARAHQTIAAAEATVNAERANTQAVRQEAFMLLGQQEQQIQSAQQTALSKEQDL